MEPWTKDGQQARILVGMQRLPHDQLREALSPIDHPDVDNRTALRLKQRLAEQFRDQLVLGVPTNSDEAALQRLVEQLRAGKVAVKLFLRHPLHAKLYLCFRDDPVGPVVGYLGSSNLTFSGLSGQGELHVDVLDQDACAKLSRWFEDRWTDRYCIDITRDLIEIIGQSWARQELIPPYHVYLKMAYHLSHEARAGLAEFRIPRDFGHRLFEFQTAAVKIAAHHLNKRGGVLIGDVVGLGKTLMATAVARIFEDDYGLETLILCPKNLVRMWEDYAHEYRLRANVLSQSRVIGELSTLRRYRLVVIDESHNLRNREGKRYRAIREYIRGNDSKVILLSATPYNKTYLDLSNQLRLFVEDEQDLGIRPERLLRELGEVEFSRRHQASPRTLAAFDHSRHADDWRDLMRSYLVRRTRSFIQDNYAETDPDSGRRFLTYEGGDRSYFPARVPRTIKFTIDDADPTDQYAHLYAPGVVATVNELHLPRYGMGNYLSDSPDSPPTSAEARHIQDLSRAGKRLMGFCRTNLFKRLESSTARRSCSRWNATSCATTYSCTRSGMCCHCPSVLRTPRCSTPVSPTRIRKRVRPWTSTTNRNSRAPMPTSRALRTIRRPASSSAPPKSTPSTQIDTGADSGGCDRTYSSSPWGSNSMRTPRRFSASCKRTVPGTRITTPSCTRFTPC